LTRLRRDDERGVALIAALLVMMVCVILVAGALQLAIHSTQRSGLSRNRTASLHAAEAGLEAALSNLAQNSTCPATAGTETPLPDQNLPTESYKILAPVSCTTGGNAVIAAVGYVPNATTPVATTTLVAHVNRGQGAPVSGGSGTNGGYVFPDALFSGGSILTTGGSFSAYGTGGSVPNVVANGTINISGSQLDGLVHGWSGVTLTVPVIGGEVVGNGVNITGATVQGGTGGVFSSGSLTLTNTTVNGPAKYAGAFSNPGSTVTGTTSPGAGALPPPRQMPVFTDSSGDMQTILGVGAASNSCPGTGTGSYYDIPLNIVPCVYNPASLDGIHVLVVHGGLVTVTMPQTTTGGQLYIISAGGLGDAVTIVGTNSTLPVFAFTDGLLTVSGNLTGQLVGGGIVTAGATTVTFSPPATPAPDFAFNNTQVAPSGLGYAATIAFEYQCPGVTAC
jgi:Tfp pilus assembly protein PilX